MTTVIGVIEALTQLASSCRVGTTPGNAQSSPEWVGAENTIGLQITMEIA